MVKKIPRCLSKIYQINLDNMTLVTTLYIFLNRKPHCRNCNTSNYREIGMTLQNITIIEPYGQNVVTYKNAN